MEYTSENEIKKLPTSVKVIGILEIVAQSLALITYSLVLITIAGGEALLSKLEPDVRAKLPGSEIVMIAMLIMVLVIIGSAMILAKKKVGVFLFFIFSICGLIAGIIVSGVNIFTIIALVLAVLMVIFVIQNKEVFGL